MVVCVKKKRRFERARAQQCILRVGDHSRKTVTLRPRFSSACFCTPVTAFVKILRRQQNGFAPLHYKKTNGRSLT